jgi:VanZ family protein
MDWLKAGHVIGYFWLGFTVLYGLSARSRWSPSVALILCCLYSFTDEFHQIFTPGRSASPRDILIDTLAALAGVAIMLGVMASRNYFATVQLNREARKVR